MTKQKRRMSKGRPKTDMLARLDRMNAETKKLLRWTPPPQRPTSSHQTSCSDTPPSSRGASQGTSTSLESADGMEALVAKRIGLLSRQISIEGGLEWLDLNDRAVREFVQPSNQPKKRKRRGSGRLKDLMMRDHPPSDYKHISSWTPPTTSPGSSNNTALRRPRPNKHEEDMRRLISDLETADVEMLQLKKEKQEAENNALRWQKRYELAMATRDNSPLHKVFVFKKNAHKTKNPSDRESMLLEQLRSASAAEEHARNEAEEFKQDNDRLMRQIAHINEELHDAKSEYHTTVEETQVKEEYLKKRLTASLSRIECLEKPPMSPAKSIRSYASGDNKQNEALDIRERMWQQERAQLLVARKRAGLKMEKKREDWERVKSDMESQITELRGLCAEEDALRIQERYSCENVSKKISMEQESTCEERVWGESTIDLFSALDEESWMRKMRHRETHERMLLEGKEQAMRLVVEKDLKLEAMKDAFSAEREQYHREEATLQASLEDTTNRWTKKCKQLVEARRESEQQFGEESKEWRLERATLRRDAELLLMREDKLRMRWRERERALEECVRESRELATRLQARLTGGEREQHELKAHEHMEKELKSRQHLHKVGKKKTDEDDSAKVLLRRTEEEDKQKIGAALKVEFEAEHRRMEEEHEEKIAGFIQTARECDHARELVEENYAEAREAWTLELREYTHKNVTLSDEVRMVHETHALELEEERKNFNAELHACAEHMEKVRTELEDVNGAKTTLERMCEEHEARAVLEQRCSETRLEEEITKRTQCTKEYESEMKLASEKYEHERQAWENEKTTLVEREDKMVASNEEWSRMRAQWVGTNETLRNELEDTRDEHLSESRRWSEEKEELQRTLKARQSELAQAVSLMKEEMRQWDIKREDLEGRNDGLLRELDEKQRTHTKESDTWMKEKRNLEKALEKRRSSLEGAEAALEKQLTEYHQGREEWVEQRQALVQTLEIRKKDESLMESVWKEEKVALASTLEEHKAALRETRESSKTTAMEYDVEREEWLKLNEALMTALEHEQSEFKNEKQAWREKGEEYDALLGEKEQGVWEIRTLLEERAEKYEAELEKWKGAQGIATRQYDERGEELKWLQEKMARATTEIAEWTEECGEWKNRTHEGECELAAQCATLKAREEEWTKERADLVQSVDLHKTDNLELDAAVAKWTKECNARKNRINEIECELGAEIATRKAKEEEWRKERADLVHVNAEQKKAALAKWTEESNVWKNRTKETECELSAQLRERKLEVEAWAKERSDLLQSVEYHTTENGSQEAALAQWVEECNVLKNCMNEAECELAAQRTTHKTEEEEWATKGADLVQSVESYEAKNRTLMSEWTHERSKWTDYKNEVECELADQRALRKTLELAWSLEKRELMQSVECHKTENIEQEAVVTNWTEECVQWKNRHSEEERELAAQVATRKAKEEEWAKERADLLDYHKIKDLDKEAVITKWAEECGEWKNRHHEAECELAVELATRKAKVEELTNERADLLELQKTENLEHDAVVAKWTEECGEWKNRHHEAEIELAAQLTARKAMEEEWRKEKAHQMELQKTENGKQEAAVAKWTEECEEWRNHYNEAECELAAQRDFRKAKDGQWAKERADLQQLQEAAITKRIDECSEWKNRHEEAESELAAQLATRKAKEEEWTKERADQIELRKTENIEHDAVVMKWTEECGEWKNRHEEAEIELAAQLATLKAKEEEWANERADQIELQKTENIEHDAVVTKWTEECSEWKNRHEEAECEILGQLASSKAKEEEWAKERADLLELKKTENIEQDTVVAKWTEECSEWKNRHNEAECELAVEFATRKAKVEELTNERADLLELRKTEDLEHDAVVAKWTKECGEWKNRHEEAEIELAAQLATLKAKEEEWRKERAHQMELQKTENGRQEAAVAKWTEECGEWRNRHHDAESELAAQLATRKAQEEEWTKERADLMNVQKTENIEQEVAVAKWTEECTALKNRFNEVESELASQLVSSKAKEEGWAKERADLLELQKAKDVKQEAAITNWTEECVQWKNRHSEEERELAAQVATRKAKEEEWAKERADLLDYHKIKDLDKETVITKWAEECVQWKNRHHEAECELGAQLATHKTKEKEWIKEREDLLECQKKENAEQIAVIMNWTRECSEWKNRHNEAECALGVQIATRKAKEGEWAKEREDLLEFVDLQKSENVNQEVAAAKWTKECTEWENRHHEAASELAVELGARKAKEEEWTKERADLLDVHKTKEIEQEIAVTKWTKECAEWKNRHHEAASECAALITTREGKEEEWTKERADLSETVEAYKAKNCALLMELAETCEQWQKREQEGHALEAQLVVSLRKKKEWAIKIGHVLHSMDVECGHKMEHKKRKGKCIDDGIDAQLRACEAGVEAWAKERHRMGESLESTHTKHGKEKEALIKECAQKCHSWETRAKNLQLEREMQLIVGKQEESRWARERAELEQVLEEWKGKNIEERNEQVAKRLWLGEEFACLKQRNEQVECELSGQKATCEAREKEWEMSLMEFQAQKAEQSELLALHQTRESEEREKQKAWEARLMTDLEHAFEDLYSKWVKEEDTRGGGDNNSEGRKQVLDHALEGDKNGLLNLSLQRSEDSIDATFHRLHLAQTRCSRMTAEFVNLYHMYKAENETFRCELEAREKEAEVEEKKEEFLSMTTREGSKTTTTTTKLLEAREEEETLQGLNLAPEMEEVHLLDGLVLKEIIGEEFREDHGPYNCMLRLMLGPPRFFERRRRGQLMGASSSHAAEGEGESTSDVLERAATNSRWAAMDSEAFMYSCVGLPNTLD